MKQTNPYEDLLNIPYQKSRNHKHMSMHDRAAQFSPFAALKGYGEAIEETARITTSFDDLSESKKEELNEKILRLEEQISKKPMISVTCFRPDVYKDGGSYETKVVEVRSIDCANRFFITGDKEKIFFEEIADIEGDIFE